VSRFAFPVETYNNVFTLQLHCKAIKQMAGETEQFSIRLPMEAIEMIEKGLIPFGLYGKRRSTVAASLILDMLKQPDIRAIIREHMKPPPA
jgi:hypothetical protein